MQSSEKEFLYSLGWDDFFESQNVDLVSSTCYPARVICEERGIYRLQLGPTNFLWAAVSGKMQFSASSRESYPAVGDWVAVELPEKSERGIIQHIYSRKNILHRKQAGAGPEIQILSTNVDYAFVTTSANEDLNYRRIERYLAIALDSKVPPIILLTKADLRSEKILEIVQGVKKEFPTTPVFSVSKQDFEKADFLIEYLQTGKTSVFIGSSGVGKSTLVNFLINSQHIKTQEVREDDQKGRHTTTSRNLYISRYGGMIIDTPGVRELQLSDHAEGLNSQFSDIEGLSELCRFRDCKHQTEPGCAITAALLDGSLSKERWKSYIKLEAEIRHGLRKQDKNSSTPARNARNKSSAQDKNNDRTKKKNF